MALRQGSGNNAGGGVTGITGTSFADSFQDAPQAMRLTSSSAGSVEGPEFLSFPLKIRKMTRRQWKKATVGSKPVPVSPSSSSSAVGVEMERVSANPPVFSPQDTIIMDMPASNMVRHSSGSFSRIGSQSRRVPIAGTRSQSLRKLTPGEAEGVPPAAQPGPASSEEPSLMPDKMLGNDMMFHSNRLEEVARGGNEVGDDPNDDFELIK